MFAVCSYFRAASRKMCGSGVLLAGCGGVLGAVAWSGSVFTIPVSLVTVVLFGRVNQRTHSLGLMISYYAGAMWQMIPGAKIFFGHHVNPIEIVLLWLGFTGFLGVPWALFWSRNPRIRSWTVPSIILLLAVPPLGVIGCASPLTVAGIAFPGFGWLGLALTLLVCGLLASRPVLGLIVALACALPANLMWTVPKAPLDWTIVSTQFGGVGLDAADPVREFAIAKRIQQTALSSPAGVIVFPETVVPNWNAATEAFWSKTIQTLEHNGKTIVVGATVPFSSRQQYFNSVIIRGAGAPADFYQRIPIPVAMWMPFTDHGFPLRLDGSGIADVAGRKTAILICYEQILIWPVLTSFTHRPVLLVAIANEYWARGTSIPKIQRACVTSWSRLFHVPFVWAENT